MDLYTNTNKLQVTSTQAASTDLQISTALATTYVTTVISNPIETTTLTSKYPGVRFVERTDITK